MLYPSDDYLGAIQAQRPDVRTDRSGSAGVGLNQEDVGGSARTFWTT